MSRNAGGTYTLPAGNPVVTATTISSAWANTTLSDLATAMTDSLSRSGLGGMSAPLTLADGAVGAPGLSFVTEASLGIYRVAAGQIGIATSGSLRFSVNSSGNVVIAAPSSGTALVVTGAAAAVVISTNKLDIATDTPFVTGGNISSGASSLALGSTGAASVSLFTNNVNRVTVGSAGNFTINAPSSGITQVISSLSGSPGLAINSTGAAGGLSLGWGIVAGAKYDIYTTGTDELGIGTASSSYLTLYTNSAARVLVAPAGNVTINAPSSGTALAVNFVAGSSAIAFTDGTITSSIYSTAAIGMWFGTISGHSLNLQSNNSTRITIGSAGNVTINAPSSGDALVIGNVVGGIAVRISNIAGEYFLRASDGTAQFDAYTSGASGVYIGTTSAHTFGIYTNGYVNSRLTIGSAGNVTINAPSSGTTLSLAAVSGGTGVFLYAQDTVRSFYMGFATTHIQIGSAGAYGLQFITSGSVYATLAATGGLTIAAPSSGVALSVAGAALTPTSTQSFSATPTFNAALSNVFEMGALTANVTAMTISNATAGQTISIRLKQDGTGSRTVATPSGAKIVGAMGATASAASILTLTYSSADSRWEGAWTNLPA